jgi:alkylhydroperoxidase family enzyme
MRGLSFFLTAGLLLISSSMALAQPTPAFRFPAISRDDAAKLYGSRDLPNWALTFAKPLPKTTAAMLNLDYVHRAKNPLGPILAGRLHWAAADALDCEYARRYARADLVRAGIKTNDLKTFMDVKKLPAKEQAAVAFARKLTTAAYTVTDEEVAYLIKEFGAEQVVAMVHTVAWSNFRNRILLAINIEMEPDGPLAPIDLQLDLANLKLEAPVRKNVESAEPSASIVTKLDWRKKTTDDLLKSLEEQKARKPRIALPDPDKSPPGSKARTSKVVWTQVSMGYQPLLTKSWSQCRMSFQQESKLDRVFANSMFWVITRSNECFY